MKATQLLARVREVFGAKPSHDTPVPPAVDDAQRQLTYPHPYPDGWYVIARSDELTETPLELNILGQRLVAFRGGGKPALLDAFCPHLGANLADGCVRDGALECPFHKWRFGPDGRCAHIPYAQRVPPTIAARAWHVEDYEGMVVAYHHRGAGTRGLTAAPPYRLSPLSEFTRGGLVARGSYDAGVVRMHLVEFTENSADFQHFRPLHSQMYVPWTRVPLPGISVLHEASWEPDPDVPHIAYFRDKAELAFRGKPIPGAGAHGTARFFGPGSVVCFTFGMRDLGEIALYQTHTPEAPLAQRVRFAWFASPRIPRALVAYVVGSWITQWREDIRIWERKVFRRKPMLVPEDGPIHALRRWYAQFYPDLDSTTPATTPSDKAGHA